MMSSLWSTLSTAERIERTTALIRSNMSFSQAARELETTRSAIAGVMNRNKIKPAPHKTPWTDEMIAKVRELVAEGYGATGIAIRIEAQFHAGRSFDSVRSLLKRLDLKPGRGKKRDRAISRAPRRKAEPAIALVAAPAPAADPIPFALSGEFVCKAFLPGEPATSDGLVCGAPVSEGNRFRFCVTCSRRLCMPAPRIPSPVGGSGFVIGKRRAA